MDRPQMDENNWNNTAALHFSRDLKSVKRKISGAIGKMPSPEVNEENFTDTIASKPLKGCGWSKDDDDDDDDRGKRTQIIALPLSSLRSSYLPYGANSENLREILTDLEIMAMSLPADDADSSSSRDGNGVIDVLVIPKPLARNHSFPEGGGYPVRGGGGMWRGDSNHIGSGGGFNCERDDRPGDDNSSNCAHWRSGNRRSLQPQLTSSVYSGGCLMVDGFRRRPDSDLARTSNQPEKPMERRNWCDNPERFLYPDYLGPNRMTTRAWSKRVPGVSSAFRCHPNRPPSNRQWCRRRRPPARLRSKSGGGRKSSKDGYWFTAVFTFRMLYPFISSSRPSSETHLASQPTGRTNQDARIELTDSTRPPPPDLLNDRDKLRTPNLLPDDPDGAMTSAEDDRMTLSNLVFWEDLLRVLACS